MRCLFFVAACWLPLVAVAHAEDAAQTGSVGVAMTEAAQKFLAALDADQLAKATRKFDDPARVDWHNIPKPQRKGLQVRDMNDEQRRLCFALLHAALSDVGYDKALKIMSLESNLREGEKDLKNGPLRDPQRYFLTIFGKPETAGTWGWSIEGHHYSQNFVIRDGHVVSDTPSFWGANPATVRIHVPGGPEVGTRTLGQEEQLAFDLVHSLDDAQRKRAIIAQTAPAEYRAAGRPQPPHAAPEGLAAADMTAAQKKILGALLETYNGNLAPELRDARLASVKSGGLDRVFFAWAGGTKPGVPHYYRIQGPTFVLELVNVQSDPAGNPANHIHSVWRNLEGDFGLTAR
ncbi:MAG TPA: DUF3500 domain-containing protein [Pirellulales bacterium]